MLTAPSRTFTVTFSWGRDPSRRCLGAKAGHFEVFVQELFQLMVNGKLYRKR